LHALQNAGGPAAVIFDDIYKLQARGIDVGSLSSDVFVDDRLTFPAVFVLADNWSTRRGFNPLNPGVLGPNDHLALLSDLIVPEIEALLDKLIDAERSGAIKEMAQLAPRLVRLALVLNAKDRVIAHVLLKLRYGKQIGELLRDEYESLADEAAKQFYRTVVLLGALDTGTPDFMVTRFRKLVAADFAVGRFERLYFEQEAGEFRIRHPILQRTLINVLFPDRDARGAALIDAITKLNLERAAERHFSITLFASARIPRRLHELFERDADRTQRFVQDLEANAAVFEDAELGALLFAFIGTIYKDILSRFDRAEIAFERAYKLDSDNPYVLRQRAWTAFRRGDLIRAEECAREAVLAWPKDVLTVSQSAFVLSCCSAQGFDTAAELYREIDPIEMTPDLRRHWERFQEAEALIRHTGQFSSSDVLQALRAPSFVWRARKHAVSVVGRQMFRELAGTLADDRNIELDADIVDEKTCEFKDKVLGSDKRLLGLLKGNVARFQFEQLRDFGKDSVDIDKVEETFKAALGLFPDEPFIVCWYGTFLKDAKDDYKNAEVYYRRALTLSRSARQEWIKNHPIFENNLALLFMDGVYKQIYPGASSRDHTTFFWRL
jgi:tetratricopeptide (TPR) repeat protein